MAQAAPTVSAIAIRGDEFQPLKITDNLPRHLLFAAEEMCATGHIKEQRIGILRLGPADERTISTAQSQESKI